MLKNIKFIFTDLGIVENYFSKSIIHLESPFLESHVLCGEAYDDEFCKEHSETKERVNCKECIRIVNAIKSVKKSQLNLSFNRKDEVKKNTMECSNCEKIFEFGYDDIVEFFDFGVGEYTKDYVVCPHCKEKQVADYDYYKK